MPRTLCIASAAKWKEADSSHTWHVMSLTCQKHQRGMFGLSIRMARSDNGSHVAVRDHLANSISDSHRATCCGGVLGSKGGKVQVHMVDVGFSRLVPCAMLTLLSGQKGRGMQ